MLPFSFRVFVCVCCAIARWRFYCENLYVIRANVVDDDVRSRNIVAFHMPRIWPVIRRPRSAGQ